jgi:hypothetical protein
MMELILAKGSSIAVGFETAMYVCMYAFLNVCVLFTCFGGGYN